jgi:hypothetical protein
MKTLIRLSEFLLWLLGWATAITLLCAMCSCTSVKYVPVETVKTDSVRVVDVQRDSIHILDSVFVREKNDTVYLTRWKTVYKEHLKTDTIVEVRVDSINTVVEVEKKLTKVQQLKMDVGAGVLYAMPILIAVGFFLLYRKLKK